MPFFKDFVFNFVVCEYGQTDFIRKGPHNLTAFQDNFRVGNQQGVNTTNIIMIAFISWSDERCGHDLIY